MLCGLQKEESLRADLQSMQADKADSMQREAKLQESLREAQEANKLLAKVRTMCHASACISVLSVSPMTSLVEKGLKPAGQVSSVHLEKTHHVRQDKESILCICCHMPYP